MRISEEIVRKVIEENSILDVVSDTVKLKKSGKYYTGLCPFHNEKTPSFTVTPEKGIYKCFGCGEAGNVITFYCKTKNLTYHEAIVELAKRAHIEISYDGENDNRREQYRDNLIKLNVLAAKFFYRNLKEQKIAYKYLRDRGITQATITSFGLGYAMDSYTSLMRYLKSQGFSELDMVNAGLILKSQKKENSYYDRFRNRIIFPVFDHRGRVIGFGGRVLDDSKPKYLNSPETELFKKGTNLYGLNFSLKDGLRDRKIIIVEGYMDCISLHQSGINNVVASLGTALTINQAKLLKRYCDEVIISYDADVAGQNATLRGLEILKNEGFLVKVLKVPSGKDPDEYVNKFGKDAFLKLINDASSLTSYKLKSIRDTVDFKDELGKLSYVKKSTIILKDLDSIEKSMYVKNISEDTGISEDAIYEILNSHINLTSNLEENSNFSPSSGTIFVEPAYINAERDILRIMMLFHHEWEKINEIIHRDELVVQSHRDIYDLILKYKDEDKIFDKVTAECMDIEASKELANIINRDAQFDPSNLKDILKDCKKKIILFSLEKEKKEILSSIKQLEKQNNMQEIGRLTKRLMEIQNQLGSV